MQQIFRHSFCRLQLCYTLLFFSLHFYLVTMTLQGYLWLISRYSMFNTNPFICVHFLSPEMPSHSHLPFISQLLQEVFLYKKYFCYVIFSTLADIASSHPPPPGRMLLSTIDVASLPVFYPSSLSWYVFYWKSILRFFAFIVFVCSLFHH